MPLEVEMSLRHSEVVLAIALVLAASAYACGGEDDPADDTGPSELISRGQAAFEANCAACHGKDLEGTKSGPPFLDSIYAPDHHPDESFYSAVENGVQPHHWDFGPMPPQPAVTEEQVEQIVAFVRAQQEEAGIIESQP